MAAYGAAQKVRDCWIGANGGAEHKEAQKSQKQDVVGLKQNFSVKNQERKRHKKRHEGPKVGSRHDRRKNYDKKRKVENPFSAPRRIPAFKFLAAVRVDRFTFILPEQEQNEQVQKARAKNPQGQHHQHKGLRAYSALAEQKQILRASKRSQQRAANRRYVLKSQDRQNIALFSAGLEQKDCERNKNNQRNVVGDKHRRQKNRVDKKTRKTAHGLYPRGSF